MNGRAARGSGTWQPKMSFVALGVAGVGTQTYLAREYLVVLAGDETSIAIGLATWLCGIAIGAALARCIRRLSATHLASACFGLLAPSGLLEVLLARSGRRLARLDAGELAGLGTSWLLSIGVFLLPGILVGAAFVALATRVATRNGKVIRSVGELYVFESLGSLAAGLLISWLLVAWTTTYVGYSLLLALALLLWVTAAWHGFVSGFGALAIEMVLIVTFSLTPLCQHLEAATQRVRFESQLPNGRLLDWTETHSAHLALSQGETHALFTSGAYTFSFPDPFEDESRAHSLMLLNQSPKRVLLLGSFEPGMLQYLLKHPVQRVDWVSLDASARSFTLRWLDFESRRAFSDPRVHIWSEDPRRWLSRAPVGFDLVLLLEREPTTLLLSRNTTLEFARLIRAKLVPNGTFVVRFASGPNLQVGQRSLMGASLYRTLQLAFRWVRATPEPVSVIVAGPSSASVALDGATLEQRWTSSGVSSEVIFPATLDALFPSERIATLNAELERATGVVATNTDNRPITFAHALASRQQLANTAGLGVLARALEHPLVVGFLAILPSVLLLTLGSLLRPTRRAAAATLHAACVVGAVGMALSIMILFSFQTYVGALYSELGLLSGLFMLGLAIGGSLGMRQSSMIIAELASMGSCSLSLVFWAIASSVHLPSAMAAVAHAALLVLAGSATGMAFPIAASTLLELGASARSAATWLEAADHAGAALAALITAVVLVPALGLTVTAALLLVLLAVACLLSLLTARSRALART